MRLLSRTRIRHGLCDHYQVTEGVRKPHPVIDYQPGSVRDDFDFGSVLLFKTAALQEAFDTITHQPEYQYSALYAVRLALSQKYELTHIREFLYTEIEEDTRLSGEKQFDYVDPRNRSVQLERETAFTYYLKNIHAFLPPVERKIDLSEGEFAYEASVITPVRNRIRTIADATESVLKQETDFPFNLIVIDNHSTDGTTECIDQYAGNEKVIHLIPERDDLGIGGCWNLGVHHPLCGRFAVQLDSDDLYSSPSTLQTIVDKFRQERCAMVIGSYRMTNFQLETLPPGASTTRNGLIPTDTTTLSASTDWEPACFLHAAAAENPCTEHQLWRRLCVRTGFLPGIPHRTYLRCTLFVPSLGRQFDAA